MLKPHTVQSSEREKREKPEVNGRHKNNRKN